ncbi:MULTISPECIES: response regulator transcription factor [Streptomyces]|uniref:DNA-binding response regulator n=2 Tax=Streptomyces TaxID=1883 RepID=D6BCB9_9ACTN|nr:MULTISPECIES: response regulator transcription factor [Streptomyces]MYX51486.1 response regulator [Streptomyces sp. SID8385]BDH49857.1 DNA-binding response regulator [Streptomyces albus]AGI87244.1 LuxR family two-component system response regulator [Streptomyces albidoflavus]ALM37774.1 LuxR family two-component system response regulator [Streptomyces sp. FR-008]EFE84640.1 luxR family two-component system response regulator [Streptomyces albidoflavus]
MSDTSAPSTASEPIRVFILDDHEVVRRGVRDLLEAEEGIVVVGEASDARQALARVPATRPQVAVLDVRLGDDAGGDHAGIEVCRELRARMPELVCLMLTSFDDDEALFDAIMAGASGYVLKQINGADLVSAVRTVASGTSMLDPRTTARVMARLRGGPADSQPAEPEQPSVLDRLSPREREILELIGEGLTNREIAERLYLAEKTVKNRISAILSKLGVGRRIQAAMIAGRLRERSS